MNIEAALKEAMNIDGALGVSLVDWESGMSLGAVGGGKYLDLDVAAAGNTEVIRAKRQRPPRARPPQPKRIEGEISR